jgi:microcystin-dependent protein
MSRNGAGTYNLPAGNPVVPATVISTTWANSTLSDIATALTGSIAADGQTPVTGNLQMSSNLITGLGNGVSAQDAVTVSQLTTQISAVNSVVTGSIQMWPLASAPTGYLLCSGAAVSRTTYAALFAILGTTFGAGDGSTTFNLPNYTDRMPIGSGTIAALAATGGSKDAVVVSHTHTITDGGHSHSYGGYGTYGSIGVSGSGVGLLQGYSPPNTASAVTGISVNTAGVSGTNANLPPYLGINFIIKI